MISKVKSRNASFGGNNFRYKVSSKPVSKGVYELNITVQSEVDNASKLLVSGVMQHDYNIKPPQGGDDYKYHEIITRIDIEGYIHEAIDLGWRYQDKGQDFTLASSNEPFRRSYEDNWKVPEGWYQARLYQFKNQRG